ncbi:hypothetical protein B0T26DRAFT_756735 [Lasiosphaeria miniovina]|uniref:Protein kinase domain-containing protein n=1 Tax=Lasiosphaeria miniovina TaxID=1954250 RepID=A0AA39ZTB1_9PEZI|nr:uncharacterized protein B0T26DRAFT_756735 [Lasiosphaeria miniovina]KAK0703170.1 hypothetical protein B0T26DRAFT_756735 [Lasiosphaeria miniovina]
MPLTESGKVDIRRLRTWDQNINEDMYQKATGGACRVHLDIWVIGAMALEVATLKPLFPKLRFPRFSIMHEAKPVATFPETHLLDLFQEPPFLGI